MSYASCTNHGVKGTGPPLATLDTPGVTLAPPMAGAALEPEAAAGVAPSGRTTLPALLVTSTCESQLA
jgi:hypothetical protein